MKMKTFNIYWLFSTCVLVWFLFIYSPIYFHSTHKTIDIPFGIHLLGAYSISLVCIINTLITPSMYGANRSYYHNRIGQYGMIMGVIEFIFGFYCCWYPYRKNLPPLSFSIAITAGGIGQLILQYYSYTSIKLYQSIKKQIIQEKESLQLQQQQHQNTSALLLHSNSNQYGTANQEIQLLEKQKQQYLIDHINSNISLFTIACGAPAFIRLVGKIVPENNPSSTLIVIVAILFLQIISICYIRYFHKYIIVQQPINNDLDGIVVVDPIQNSNSHGSNNTIPDVVSSAPTTAQSRIDTTAETTTANNNNASTPLLQ